MVVVLGARARNYLKATWSLAAGFGVKHTVSKDESANLAVRRIGDHERVVAYLWHPTGMTAPKHFAGSYPTRLAVLKAVANGQLPPARFRA